MTTCTRTGGKSSCFLSPPPFAPDGLIRLPALYIRTAAWLLQQLFFRDLWCLQVTNDLVICYLFRVGLLGGFLDPPYSGHWIANRWINKQLIRLSLTCRNMNPSTA